MFLQNKGIRKAEEEEMEMNKMTIKKDDAFSV